MHKISDLMTALGFNENASDEVKKAFINHLVRQAFGASHNKKIKDSSIASESIRSVGSSVSKLSSIPDHLPSRHPEQLSFNFEQSQTSVKKRPA